jgi:hypothetical protein
MQPAWKQFITSRHTLIKALGGLREYGLTKQAGLAPQQVGEAQEQIYTAAKTNHLKTCSQPG